MASVQIKERANIQSAPDRQPQSGIALPSPSPQERRVPRAPSRSRSQDQIEKMLVMFFVSILGVAFGLIYLWANAQVAQEGLRRVALQHALLNERNKAQVWKQKQAQLFTPEFIDHQAQALGMIHTEEQQTVVV